MQAVWARIEARLQSVAPDVAANLNPPASAADIARTEAIVGVPFPDDVRALYRIHDGQRWNTEGLFRGWEWMSLSRIVEEWKIWKELLDGGEFEEISGDGDGRVVRTDWWNSAWIPFRSDGAGNSDCLDLAPGPQGRSGQILKMWHDDAPRTVVAADIKAWLTQFADELDSTPPARHAKAPGVSSAAPSAGAQQASVSKRSRFGLRLIEMLFGGPAGALLDLAKACIDDGDKDGAREALTEVIRIGNRAQKREAQALLEKLS